METLVTLETFDCWNVPDLDIVKMILSKLGRPYYSSSLARIAVEVGEEEDIRLLLQSERDDDDEENNYYGSYETGEFVTVEWNKTEDEDPAILCMEYIFSHG